MYFINIFIEKINHNDDCKTTNRITNQFITWLEISNCNKIKSGYISRCCRLNFKVIYYTATTIQLLFKNNNKFEELCDNSNFGKKFVGEIYSRIADLIIIIISLITNEQFSLPSKYHNFWQNVFHSERLRKIMNELIRKFCCCW